jgi:hypothetical protein
MPPFNIAIAAALLAALSLSTYASQDLTPRPNDIFPVLVADPRHIGLSASYTHLNSDHLHDFSLGQSLGIKRWRTGMNQDWLWETDIEAMAQPRVRSGGVKGELQAVDLILNLPVTARRGDVSFKGLLFHESSHLGDDYIRRTGHTGSRFSAQGLRVQAGLEPFPWMRVYGGGAYRVFIAPSIPRASLQAGIELSTPDLHWSRSKMTSLFIAEDLQSQERTGWNLDLNLLAGIKISGLRPTSSDTRLAAGWYYGHSPFGQFYRQRENRLTLTMSLNHISLNLR